MPKKAGRPAPNSATAPVDRLAPFAVLPLRLFLGLTFLYGGVQKIADPGFLQPGASTYIGTQLTAFAAHSPVGFLLTAVAEPNPQLTGIAVIVAELVIGAATVLGIGTRWAAAAGAAVNFGFFLTASWTVQPYFLGSDSIYTVAWITLVLTGDLGVLTAGPYLADQLGVAKDSSLRRKTFDPSRRRLLLEAGGAAVALVWLLSVIPRLKAGPVAVVTPSPSPSSSPATSPTAGGSPSAAPSPTPAGTRIGTVADLQAQGFLPFQDPASGDPGLVVQVSGGKVVAFDALCTHAGCQVNYDTGQKLFTCPCHGAEFDPAQGAAVVAGPAPTPLASIKVEVTAGTVYTA